MRDFDDMRRRATILDTPSSFIALCHQLSSTIRSTSRAGRRAHFILHARHTRHLFPLIYVIGLPFHLLPLRFLMRFCFVTPNASRPHSSSSLYRQHQLQAPTSPQSSCPIQRATIIANAARCRYSLHDGGYLSSVDAYIATVADILPRQRRCYFFFWHFVRIP